MYLIYEVLYRINVLFASSGKMDRISFFFLFNFTILYWFCHISK